MKKINSETAYNTALGAVYELMQKGEKNISDRDAENISAMAKAIQQYEKIFHPFPLPKTLNEMGKSFASKWARKFSLEFNHF